MNLKKAIIKAQFQKLRFLVFKVQSLMFKVDFVGNRF
jgi:hypothetical protein